MKRTRTWLFVLPLACGLSYLALDPTPAYAIFGIGDIVFDPSSWAEIGEVWSQDISNGAKLVETYNQTVKIVKNGLDAYNLAMTMAQRVENKNVWKMAAFAVGSEEMKDHYGESINWSAAMNGDVLNAAHAYNESKLGAAGAAWLGPATANNSSRMANYASLQMLDQVSERCAGILANYKQSQDANQDAEDQLNSDTFDSTDAKNSMVAVLNVLSGGHIHLKTQEKANGNLQACLAEQATIKAKIERDKLAQEHNWYWDVAQGKATQPAAWDSAAAGDFVAANYLEP